MSNCVNIRPLIGCFTPTNPANDPVNIIIHVIYGEDGKPKGQSYTLEDTETPIDITTYLGGGTVTVGCCDERVLTHTLTAGVGNIPAGLKGVRINNLSGITTINPLGYELGNGRRDNSVDLTGQEHGVNGILPAITMSGGTWQWLGMDKL